MARVDLLFENVRSYGYPHACLYCCSDEDPKGSKIKYGSNGVGCLGLGCLAFFMGPLVWIIGLVVFFLKRDQFKGKSGELGVPVCQNCLSAKKSITHRLSFYILIPILAMGAVTLTPNFLALHSTLSNWVLVCGFLAMGYGTLEYCILERQFSAKVVKSTDDRIILDLPNDEYPSLYQRHLDTALLYGSVEKLGTMAEDFKL